MRSRRTILPLPARRRAHRGYLAMLLATAVLILTAPFPAITGAEGASGRGDPHQPVGHLPTAEDFVTQQYEDFLSRQPDDEGLTYWTGRLSTGLDPSALVEALAQSAEFEGTVAPVVRLYYAHFLRAPDYGGLAHWSSVARGGWSIQQISEEFVRSDEFAARYGALDDGDYVEQVYRNVLERDPDDGGRAYWLSELASGLSRGAMMVAFSDSAEYRTRTGAIVQSTMLYVGMLRRVPESEGLDYWSGVIGEEAPYRDVISGFLGADEYRRRIDRIYAATNPLTGVPTRRAPTHAALAVKIDNVDSARPQTSIDRADIVVEEMVEGNLTRLIAVFHADRPSVVGPVRSVRTTDIDVLAALNTPLLSASGANPGVLAAVDASQTVVNVNALAAGGAYYRSSSRSAPHNLYARVDDLYAVAGGRGGTPSGLFTYRRPGQGPIGGAASTGVGIEFGRADIEYTWSASDRGWRRSQNGRSHVTAEGTLLAPENVVVLEVPYGASAIDARSPEAHTVGTGPAYVFTGGELVVGTWGRAAATDPFTLRHANGHTIGLSRGQTFVELAPPGSIRLR